MTATHIGRAQQKEEAAPGAASSCFFQAGVGLVALAATAAAAATVAAAATAAATAAAAVAAATTAAAAATVFARLGFVNGEGPAVDFLAVQGRDRRLGFLVGAHLDEPESLAAAGVPVLNDFRALHGPVRGAQLFEVRAGRVIAQVPDVQLAAHVKLLLLFGPDEPAIYFP